MIAFYQSLFANTNFQFYGYDLIANQPLVGPKQWLAARWLSKSTCEGDVPPLDLPKSNYGLCTDQVTKSYRPSNGQQISLRGAGIFTCT